MKKIYSILAALVAAVAILTSCSDVPMPYDLNNGKGNSLGKSLPYKNASLSAFSTLDLREGKAAWSKGSTYTQATGLQDWDGSGKKTYVEVESYLISPALCTKSESGKVKFSFDHTLRYSDKVSNWKNNHKIFISKDYTGRPQDFADATWEQIEYTPAASTYSDWTLYSSGEIAIPEDYVNCDPVYIAFYFYAPASASTTWELENFLIMESEAGNIAAPEGAGTKDSPLTVAQAKAMSSGTGYVGGYIVGYVDGTKLEGAKFEAAPADATTKETEILLADTPDETNYENVFPVQLPVGDLRTMLSPNNADNIGKQVIVYGTFATYFGTNGMKETSWALLNGQTIGKDPDAAPTPLADPKGNGTLDNPFNVAGAIKYVQSLGADVKSDKELYVEGIVTRNITKDADITSYGNLTFFISDDGTENNEFEAYQVYGLNKKKVSETNYVKKGDKVILCGKILNFRGNTPETDGKGASYIYSLNGTAAGTTDTEEKDPAFTPGEGFTVSDNVVTIIKEGVRQSNIEEIDLNQLGYTDGNEIDKITTQSGIEIKFDKGTNTYFPKFYSITKGVRVYANNIVTIIGKEDIARVSFLCDVYNNVKQVGNPTAYASIEGNKVVFNNYFDGTGGGVQLRIQKIVVAYVTH